MIAPMKRIVLLAGSAAVGLAGWSVLHAQDTSAKTTASDAVVYASAERAAYKPGPVSGVEMATVWGDPQTGPHGQFTKMAPGYDAGTHTHTSTLELIVLKGAYLYHDAAGDKRVAAGEFLRIPGGHKHSSSADKAEGALFYEQGDGKFDLVPEK